MSTGPQDPNAPRETILRSQRRPDHPLLTIPAGGPYRITYDFDLARSGILNFTATLIAFDLDGEAPGSIAADLYDWRTFLDADHTLDVPIGGGISWVTDDPFDGDPAEVPVVTSRVFEKAARYLTITPNIIDANTFDPYAGANNPSATWRIDFA